MLVDIDRQDRGPFIDPPLSVDLVTLWLQYIDCTDSGSHTRVRRNIVVLTAFQWSETHIYVYCEVCVMCIIALVHIFSAHWSNSIQQEEFGGKSFLAEIRRGTLFSTLGYSSTQDDIFHPCYNVSNMVRADISTHSPVSVYRF